MPGLVGHNHLDQHIAGEYLALHGLGAVVRDLGDSLHGNVDLGDEVFHVAVFHRFLDAGRHGVLIARVSVGNIPFQFVSHVPVPSEEVEQGFDHHFNHPVEHPDEHAHQQYAHDDDAHVLSGVLGEGQVTFFSSPLRSLNQRTTRLGFLSFFLAGALAFFSALASWA